MLFKIVCSSSAIPPTASITVWQRCRIFMAVGILFPKGVILDIKVLLTVNYFAANKGDTLICRVLIEAEMILFCVYGQLYVIYFQMSFYTVL